MFELHVETEFAAAHAISMGGRIEPLHGHNWHVTVCVAGERLDDDGLVCDFHLIESHLRDLVGVFHNRNLNETAPFDEVNPTAELVAKHFAETLQSRIADRVPPGVRISWVSVTEAPGCTAVYRMPSES